jgi:hypothetical protein
MSRKRKRLGAGPKAQGTRFKSEKIKIKKA